MNIPFERSIKVMISSVSNSIVTYDELACFSFNSYSLKSISKRFPRKFFKIAEILKVYDPVNSIFLTTTKRFLTKGFFEDQPSQLIELIIDTPHVDMSDITMINIELEKRYPELFYI